VDRIVFSRLGYNYGCFSNFYRRPFDYRGRRWLTSEHAYQAQKFLGSSDQLNVWMASTPTGARRIGNDPLRALRPDWEEPSPDPVLPHITKVKDRVMYDVCLAKFREHKDLIHTLLDTGGAEIVEDGSEWGDAYWAETSPGVGQNKLGKVLMAVRDQLRRDALDELVRLTEEHGGYDADFPPYPKRDDP
jgi:N-glycosidase YbiA